MGLFKYTTNIAAEQSLGEITGMLAKAGAHRVVTDYEGGRISALEFTIELDGEPLSYRLTANVEGARRAMVEELRRQKKAISDTDHARNVAWRIMREWVAVQTALVECEQASLAQIFFPYAIAGSKQTAFEAFRDQRNLAIGGGSSAAKRIA